jgi:gluconate 5-dehydrogenase
MHSYLNTFSLAGKIALITGAGRGLGLEVARAMAGSGAHVILNGRDGDRLQDAVKSITEAGQRASIAPFDVADPEAANKAFDTIARTHGRLDILVNNVGARNRKPLLEFSNQDVRDLIETNLIAGICLAREAARLMLPHRAGRLITITSIAGHVARAGDAVYTSTKHGLTGMVRALAAEYGPFGITSNAIAPGGFATEANEAMLIDPKIAEHFATRTVLGRWGQPEEIAGAAVFLASSASSYITGHVLTVDGGLTIKM